MPDFEILDGGDLTRPFKNKKLAPFMVAGVVGVAALAVLRKSGGSNEAQTETAYQATYASNTGVTSQVSTMLEDQKATVTDMLAAQQEAQTEQLEIYSEQMESYMEQLNSMFDTRMEAFDYELEKQQAAVEQQITQSQEQYNKGFSDLTEQLEATQEANNNLFSSLSNQFSNLSGQISDLKTNQKQQTTTTSRPSSSGGSYTPSANYDDFNITNGRESNTLDDGRTLLTYGLFDWLAETNSPNTTSHSNYGSNSNFYYEDKSGNISSSPVTSMSQSTDASGRTTTTLNFADGSKRVVSNIPNN